MVAALVRVMLAVTGAGQAWARVGAAVELPGVGAARLGAVEVTGNDLARSAAWPCWGWCCWSRWPRPRGRGRWVVGVALLALGGALTVQLAGAAGVEPRRPSVPAPASSRAIPAGTALRVDSPRAGPALVVAGRLLLAAARAKNPPGAALAGPGRRLRAPPDRAEPAADAPEPPWEGD